MKFLNNKLIISHGGKNGSWNNLYNTQEISIYEDHWFFTYWGTRVFEGSMMLSLLP